MHTFAQMAKAIFDTSENIHLIVSPTKRILKNAFFLFVIAVALLTFSIGFLTVITIPLLLFEIYFYYLFCKIWRSYKFSVLYLILIPIAAFSVSIGFKIIIYNYYL